MDINEIVLELKKHDYSHFDEFYELTNKTIYFTSLAILKEHTLAEDILQDTYLSFFANINKQKSILTNDEILVSTPDVERNNDRDIDNILNLLDSQEEREIVTLHVILDYKFIEISRIVDKPLGTVLWIYNKAIKKLKERIGDILWKPKN